MQQLQKHTNTSNIDIQKNTTYPQTIIYIYVKTSCSTNAFADIYTKPSGTNLDALPCIGAINLLYW